MFDLRAIGRVASFLIAAGLLLLLAMPGHLIAQDTVPLDPETIPKFVEPLVIPPALAPNAIAPDGAQEYEIAVRQFNQQILPSGFPQTPVFGYGRAWDPLPGGDAPSTFNFPAFTIEAETDTPVRVTWFNHLVDDPTSDSPQYLPHLLPVDPTVHWANPAGAAAGETRSSDPQRYTGPVPIVNHLHGGNTPPVSDGYPEAWYLPDAANIPEGYATQGGFFQSVEPAPTGAAVFEYPNNQRAGTMWFHDHTLGMTRLNVYAGMAGFYLMRDDIEQALNLPGPAPQVGDAPGTRYYEIPVAIQDRSFNADGTLFYPDSRTFFDGYEGPYFPESAIPPIWNPEFFGDTIVVNGRTWPYLEVEPRLYRLRLLNGTGSRFLVLAFDQALPFHVIGVEGGLLPDQPLTLDQLLMAPAERFDVIVDFSAFEPGEEIMLLNFGPDEPFGGLPVEPDAQANPETTGQIMQFRVVERTDQGNPGEIPDALPPIAALETELPERFVTLNEEMSEDGPDGVPVAAVLGTPADGPLAWMAPITENPQIGDTEVWTVVNMTMDSHPIHIHEVMFQVIERIPFDDMAYHEAQEAFLLGRRAGPHPDPYDFVTGEPIPANPWEVNAWKDTVIANPGQLTRLIMTFDQAGLYVWHCHILEHEDNEMMRPYYVGEIPEGFAPSGMPGM